MVTRVPERRAVISTNAELVTTNVIQTQTASILSVRTPVSVSQVTKGAESYVNPMAHVQE